MWIETDIKQLFQSRAGLEMVRFTAAKGGGQLWAASADMVREGLGKDALAQGDRVEIEIENGRLVAVRPFRPRRQDNEQEVGRSPPSDEPRRARHSSTEAFAMTTAVPYGFVPIDIEHSIADRPVLHDGSGSDGTDGGELFSGEILCSLETLTPLLPGNARYAISEADEQKLRDWGMAELRQREAKQIAEPLRLSDGRVVIAGSALKGMIRHSLSALFSAPMERVGERHYTYRPNLDFGNNPEKYVVRPAFVTVAKNGGWDVEVFAGARDALFVRSNAEHAINSASTGGALAGLVHNVKREGQRIVADRGAREDLAGYRIAIYKGGIDGQGLLGAAFVPPTRTYKMALVPQAGTMLHIDSSLYQQYLEDQRTVLANEKIGHLAAHPLAFNVDAIKTAIRNHAELHPRQLVYVELTTDKNGKVTSSSKITSFGHLFRYRWAYTSSIREKNGKLRDCLTPTADERSADVDGKPRALTAARLLFGYVRDDEKNPVGKGPFQRLAGRIAVNHAVSQTDVKFLGEKSRGYCVSLPILGQPKPSAWEFYLRQDGRKDTSPQTYGDLPGQDGGDLAGRKFYGHQSYDQSIKHIKMGEIDIDSEQATLARYIVDRGVTFKFAVRFARLRQWELGALMAVLNPSLLGEQDKTYAHKVGLGRPLGMGSVRIGMDKMLVRHECDAKLPGDDNRAEFETGAVHALKEKFSRSNYTPWLRMHAYIWAERVDYPREQARRRNPGDPTIFDWHTSRRREYSVLRREKDPDWKMLRERIQKAKGGEY